MGDFFVGLDLGQANDYTALGVVERLPAARLQDQEYHLRHLERPALGTPYPAIVTRVADLLARPELAGAKLVVDGTGVGRPVVDLLVQAKLYPVPVTIHGGDSVQQDGGGYRVPKRDLVGALQVLFQSGRLKVAQGLPEAATLTKELLNFKVQINLRTAHDTYEAWREGQHDDLVLAVALACWYGQRQRVFTFA